MLLWETDTGRFGQVSCMLDLCASDCVHGSGGVRVADPLCAPLPNRVTGGMQIDCAWLWYTLEFFTTYIYLYLTLCND